MATDIDPHSGMRLPLPRREDLSEAGQKTFDSASVPGFSLVGLRGPIGIQLYSPNTAALSSRLNQYLRFEAGFTGRVREIAILITAREMDSQFEWAAHETVARKEGVPEQAIDAIKHRRTTAGLDRVDALVIDLGRELWHDHKVRSATFAALQAEFGSTGLIELVMLMGNYASAAALLSVVDMQLHPGKQPPLPVP